MYDNLCIYGKTLEIIAVLCYKNIVRDGTETVSQEIQRDEERGIRDGTQPGVPRGRRWDKPRGGGRLDDMEGGDADAAGAPVRGLHDGSAAAAGKFGQKHTRGINPRSDNGTGRAGA